MDRYPRPDEVLDSLGDKVTHALSEAVVGARDDLSRYREALPDLVADHSTRGLASWLHDRMWARAVAALGDLDRVTLVDSGPTREIFVGFDFRLRLKRHSKTGAIRSYPTAAALDFISQEPDLLSLIGIRTLNLTAGYEWDHLTREIGDPVISLRNGSFEEVIWVAALPLSDEEGGATVAPIRPTDGDPSAPVIDVPAYPAIEHEEVEDE